MKKRTISKKEAIYTRQSIDKKDSVSIETQEAECQKIVRGEFAVYTDRGYSGKNTSRPSLQRLLKDIQLGRVSRVVVYRLDRISRNITDFYNLYETMKIYGCEFVSVSESFDTNGVMGRAMMGIIAVFAQMERETIQQRIRDNYYFRITDGRWAGGPAPIGYDNAKTIDRQATLRANNDLEVVKRAFDLYINENGISLTRVARILTEEGYQINGKNLWAGTLSRIFRNPVYAVADELLYTYYKGKQLNFLNQEKDWTGETSASIVGKTQGKRRAKEQEYSIYLTNIRGIIDSKSFLLVQDRLSRNQSFRRANSSSTRMEELAGLVKCAECGYAVRRHSRYPTLTCTGRSRLHTCIASFRGVRLSQIQDQVAEYCQAFLDDRCHKDAQDEEKRMLMQDRANVIEREITRLVNTSASNELFAAAAVRQIENRQQELHNLNLILSLETTDEVVQEMFDTDEIREHRLLYRDLSPENKKRLCRKLIRQILLYEDGTVQIIPKEDVI